MTNDPSSPLDPASPDAHQRFQPPRALSQPSVRNALLLALIIASAVAVVSCSIYTLGREEPAGISGADYVGWNSCAGCHDDVVAEFRRTDHGHLLNDTHHGCESCHGPGSLHIETGGEAAMIVKPNDANCLACHGASRSYSGQGDKKTLMDWHFASHKRASVKCINCHNAHSHVRKGLRVKTEFQVQNTDAASSLCLSCHPHILGRISMPYHHPIREGAMICTNCHDPHGNQARQLLSVNETCTKCHQAQQGLFVREHQPVAESCTICHDPHGSPVPKMTKIGQPMLCLQCHSLTDNRHVAAGVVSPSALRDCTACHGAIHGSDIDAYLRH